MKIIKTVGRYSENKLKRETDFSELSIKPSSYDGERIDRLESYCENLERIVLLLAEKTQNEEVWDLVAALSGDYNTLYEVKNE